LNGAKTELQNVTNATNLVILGRNVQRNSKELNVTDAGSSDILSETVDLKERCSSK
jgi:hypothetical protein